MKKAGITNEQVARFEINEAFSAVAIANMKILGLDASKVNVVRRTAAKLYWLATDYSYYSSAAVDYPLAICQKAY